MNNTITTTGEKQQIHKGRGSNARMLVRIILYSMFGIWLLMFNPYGLNDRADAITQQTLYRLFSPLYHSKSRDYILVVLLTQQGIENLHKRGLLRANTWPIQYRDHAYILSRILKESPRAIFIDIFFDRERSTDDSLASLVSRIKYGTEENQADIFYASGFSVSGLTPVQKQLDAAGPVITGWESLGDVYPLTAMDAAALECRNNLCRRPSAAVALYGSYCLDNESPAGCNREALLNIDELPAYVNGDPSASEGLSIYWGSEPPAPHFAEDTVGKCEQGASNKWGGLWRVIRNIFGGLVGEDAAKPFVSCPYHQFVTADFLVSIMRNGTEAEKEQMRNLLRDKVVLYGLSLEGVDTFTSPVHGQLPGVFLHAMALDNLMHLGSNYLRGGVANAEMINVLIWVGLVITYVIGLRWLENTTAGTCRFGAVNTKTEEQATMTDGFWRRRCESLVSTARYHPKTAMSLFVGLLVIVIALGMFFFMHLEPVNSIAFLGLLAMLNILRGSKLEHWLLERFGLDLPQSSG